MEPTCTAELWVGHGGGGGGCGGGATMLTLASLEQSSTNSYLEMHQPTSPSLPLLMDAHRGVHPSEATMHFPRFRFRPMSEKFV